eukprot:767619-Hanusia_phi.AAC.5
MGCASSKAAHAETAQPDDRKEPEEANQKQERDQEEEVNQKQENDQEEASEKQQHSVMEDSPQEDSPAVEQAFYVQAAIYGPPGSNKSNLCEQLTKPTSDGGLEVARAPTLHHRRGAEVGDARTRNVGSEGEEDGNSYEAKRRSVMTRGSAGEGGDGREVQQGQRRQGRKQVCRSFRRAQCSNSGLGAGKSGKFSGGGRGKRWGAEARSRMCMSISREEL